MSRGKSSVVFLGFAAMATVACPLAVGCVVEENNKVVAADGAETGVAELALTTDPPDPPAGSNPFYPECFWHHKVQQTYRDLAGAPLANGQGELPAMPHLVAVGNVCRLHALRYLIKCALADGVSVTDAANGATYEGHYGLATAWRNYPLPASSKEWMTSCMLQHLNGYHTTTNLLLEGNRSGYYINTVPAGYPRFDSITWGNIWDPTNGPLSPNNYNPSTSAPAFRARICHLGDMENYCSNVGVDTVLDEKTCGAVGSACGMTRVGRCETYCSWNTADGQYSPSAYWTCGGKTASFRERLPDYDMYYPDCTPVE